ncbi:MAG TPA: hypothetical protein VK255_03205 [Patescibacteria group bacterium]|nr:hypothetical protein [Patescibacteria group bacterium]
MKYKLIFNIPNERFPTEVTITGEQMDKLAPALAEKGKIVKLNGSYFNTSYFVKATPDAEANRLEEGEKFLRLEGITQTHQDRLNRDAINELKKKIFNKL